MKLYVSIVAGDLYMLIELKVLDDEGKCKIEYDDEGKQLLLQKGLNAIIKEYLEQEEKINE